MVTEAADLNPFITRTARGQTVEGPLAGWTLAVKDLVDVAHLPTTAGDDRQSVARADAAVVSRLRRAGVAVVGKTNMDPWGLGVTGRNARWGDCRNPWDRRRISGGSSSGSAVAVAAGLASLAIGTDTAGSLRIPAALCGVTAFKPAPGLVPRRGVLGLAPTLDAVGPIARSVAECRAAYRVMNATTPAAEPARLRVGLPRGPFWSAIDADVGAAIDAAARTLERCGMRLIEVDVPAIEEAARLNGVVLLYELAHRHSRRWRAHGSGLDPRVARQLELGGQLEHREYVAALAFRVGWRAMLRAIFGEVDAILHPTTGRTAPFAAERVRTAELTRLCAAWNLAALPVLALPVGFGRDGMPVGGSLVAFDAGEATLFEIGLAYQRATEWHLQMPASMAPTTAGRTGGNGT
jgi:aspartyl-tRNA(Asn)/glutamyl-tRNA(Gln) amidotransferase subunit A